MNPARILRVPGGTLAEGAPADITVLAPDLQRHGRRRRRCGRRSKNTPFDGWQLRGGVAATIVGGRTVYRERCRRGADLSVTAPEPDVVSASIPEQRWRTHGETSTTICDAQALQELQKLDVLMLDGHFDFGNGYHGRVYLNPHQLFRQPSTIWRLAQDLLDVLPSDLLDADGSRGRPGHGRRAARAHARRPARRPREPDASAVLLRAVHARRGRHCALRPFYAQHVDGPAGAARRRRAQHRADVRALRAAGARGRRHVLATVADLRSAGGDRRCRRAELRAGRVQAPENYPAAECPLCARGSRSPGSDERSASARDVPACCLPASSMRGVARPRSTGASTTCDSATDPVHIVRRSPQPADREIVGLLRRGARVRPRGERAAVDRSAARA